VRIDHLRLRVVGVLGEKGRTPTGADQDDQLSVPITTLQRKLVGEEKLSLILAAARTEGDVEQARDEIARALRQRTRPRMGEGDDFDVSTVQEMAALAQTLTGTLQAVTLAIASISLVVGGIGIMNIMLVSVTQRTREIGIRLATGARPFDICLQFLAEATVLALAGGVLGIAVGVTGTLFVAWLAGWPAIISEMGVGGTFLVSAGVGVVFGFYPAWKASRLEPIRALRAD
jgi:putative ABC transport system permease protein